MMTRYAVIFLSLLFSSLANGQGGDQQLRAKADALFNEERFAEAMPLYSQLVSLEPGDRTLNYLFGACILYGGEDKEKAIGHLKYATEDPSIATMAWYWLGRAYHLNYRFREAQAAYQRFVGTGDKKALAKWPVDALEQQCRNGEKLLSNLKEITVRNKVEVDDKDFFRFYDLTDIGGKIVVMPEELKTSLDKRNKLRSLIYLPARGGPIYFGSYGKDGRTGLDIYRTELMPDGAFATPVKLAGYINTDQDEDFAFMHPDGKSFYFSSKGHTSMGGYDVFRAAYDKGMDAFGRPENLDFAVNTPDDDIFYMVDPEHKEACFASARSSRQGNIHVYRVGTTQLPLIITVLKGTFANELDKSDRKAHIVVKDDLTREVVADVRTDMNGSYVLALPRSGKFRFNVECGPSGRTHVGTVEVPRSETPRAYRQEMTLTNEGGVENLVIRNYFDAPLQDDIIALALDEIKRRARLDITDGAPVAQANIPQDEPGDILTRAGFTGDVDKAGAVRLAQEDAAELDRRALDLKAVSEEAYALAMAAVTEADKTASEAEAAVAQAGQEQDPDAKNTRMVEAARLRQHSRAAHLRAKAAFRTGQDIERESTATQQRAINAGRLATELQSTLSNSKDTEALPLLVKLRERLDAKSRPDGSEDVSELARRAVTENESEATRALNKANALRQDESELQDRINRAERERTEAKGNKREALDREITEYRSQLGHLHAETEAAFVKARSLESETAVLRGQASLTRHLTTANSGTGTVLTQDQVASLGQRIGGAGSRIASIPIDERYDALLTSTPAEREARTFDWDLASAADGVGATRNTTRVADGTSTAEERMTTRTGTGSDTNGSATPADRTVAQVPVGAGPGEHGTEAEHMSTRTTEPGTRPEQRTTDDRAVAEVPTGTEPEEQDGAGAETTAQGVTGQKPIAQETSASAGTDGTAAVNGGSNAATPEQVRNDAEIAAVPDATAQGTAPTTEGRVEAAMDEDTRRFMLENERAELQQLQLAERDRSKRDSIADRLQAIEAELNAAQLARQEPTATGEEQGGSLPEGTALDMERDPLVFDTAATDEFLIGELFADHAKDTERLLRTADADRRAAGLHGLELMLADSIRGEMVRQLAILELDPQQAERILPLVDRLRRLRESRLVLGERYLEERQAELAEAGHDHDHSTASAEEATHTLTTSGRDPIMDRFVAVDPDRVRIYASDIEHRSPNVGDAIAFKNADLARIAQLDAEIDSLVDLMAGHARDKEYDRLIKRADRSRDDRLIIRTDLGQRSAYLTNEEWTLAKDSLKGLEKTLERKGLAPSEPTLVMAQGFRTEAETMFKEAQQYRKRADRIDDIIARDSLYRKAYATELEALRAADRSLTVYNHLISEDHVRGEARAYTEIAASVLGLDAPETGPTAAERAVALRQGTDRITPEESTDLGSGVPPAENERGTEDLVAQQEPTLSSDPITPPSVGNSDAREGTLPDATEIASTGTDAATNEPARASEAFTERTTGDVTDQADAVVPALKDEALPPIALKPIERYESYLATENVTLDPRSLDPEEDPALLHIISERASEEAADLERRAVERSDLASARTDSAATAKRRERDRLEMLAVRDRAMADSLRSAAELKHAEARDLEMRERDAGQAKVLRDRLVKYYYLTSEEMALVVENPDESRYFQAKARALEQYDAAEEATSSAASNKELGVVLQQEADAARASGGDPSAAAVLQRRADRLFARADSLTDVASRLRGAANVNEDQATVMLQGMATERSTELMALEMRTRRTEQLLARTREDALRAAGTENAVASSEANDPLTTASTPRQTLDRSEPRVAERAAPLAPRAVPAVLTTDMFAFLPEPDRTPEPIPVDAAMPQGIVYKVQVGAFRNRVPTDAFSDMSPVMAETVGNGFVRYTAGLFTGYDAADKAKDLVRGRGYRDAFVVAYRDGRRISLAEARAAVAASQEVAARAVERPIVSTPEPVVRATAPDTLAARPVTATPADRTPVQGGTREGATAVVQAPVTPARSAEEEIAEVLASYPATAAEVIARHAVPAEAADYYNDPTAAPARQVETIKGLFFTVQVGVYSKPVALGRIYNIAPLNSERTETGKIRYTTGVFLDTDQANARKEVTIGLGVKDAFVTAYLNGKRIPMREANALLARFGSDILARP